MPRTSSRSRSNPDANNVLTVAAYGDSPYGLNPTDTTQTDKTLAFIESINNDPKVDLVLHVGDIHSGKQFCTEAYDRTIYDLWVAFKNPLIYSPGDNEWTDCHEKGGAPGYDPFSAEGANFNGTIDASIRDPISGTPAHRANRCEIRPAAAAVP